MRNYFKVFNGDGFHIDTVFFEDTDAADTQRAYKRASAMGRVCMWRCPPIPGDWDTADITSHRSMAAIVNDFNLLAVVDDRTPEQEENLKNLRAELEARNEAAPRAVGVRHAA